MTDKKVSELDAITAVDDADFLPIVDDSETTGKNKKVTVGQLKTHIAEASAGVSGTVTGHLIPDTNSAYDLGSAEKKIRHLFLSNNSVYMAPEGVNDVGSMATLNAVTGEDGIKFSLPGVDLLTDVVVDNPERGIVLKSPDGTYYRLTIANGGALEVDPLASKP